MSLRKKSFIFAFSFLVILVIILMGIIQVDIWQGFNTLEDRDITRAMERSYIGISDKIARLEFSSRDWSEWNDIYYYAIGENPKFIADNISKNQFVSLGLNYMALLDNDNKVLYFNYFDLQNKKFIESQDSFLSDALRLLSRSDKDVTSGIIDSETLEPTIMIARHILKTDGSGPVAGTLIFGRKIDPEIISSISQLTSFNFSLFRKGDINNPIFNEVAVENLSSKDVYIETSDKDIAYGYANFLKNIDEKNDLVLRVSVPREIYKNGLVVSWSIVISLLIVAVFASLIFIYIINSLIIKRIYLLINKISEVESGKSGVSDILLSGKDEISFLSGKLKSAIEKSVDVGEKATLRSRELEQSQKAILNVLEDIETEKNKIESLAGDLEKFKLAVDNASDHIVITDPDGVILYANRAVEKITGYSHSEVIGNKPSLWGKQMPEEFYNNLWKTIKEEKTNFIGELNNRRKNGEIYVAEASISPILNSNNKVIFFVGIERDITLLKEISDAKTEFVSVASHQLRTPLTGIKWLTEIMLKNRENNLTEKQKEILKDINLSNDRVIKLVNDLLSVSRIETGSKTLSLKEVEIATLINEVMDSLKPIAEKTSVDLNSAISLPEDYKITIDEDKIRQVMNNLISNAIKYSKPKDAKVDILAEIKNNEFIFSVKDNGIGIPVKDQRHVFEKFFRADNALLSQTEGTGLGLYIVRSYIESHGGRIWFESEENKGTTFYFSLKNNLV